MEEAQIKVIVDNMDSYEKLMLYAATVHGKDLKTKVKMQKLMFFCKYALPEVFDDTLDFEPHKKGPYSKDVDEILMSIEDKSLINLPSCSPTEAGIEISPYVIPKEPVKSVVDDYKDFICKLNEDELLTMIYMDFPEFQKNSDVWDDLVRKRLQTATTLMRKNAVSFSKALEISGMNQDDFERHLISNNVRWRIA
ncbi:hypothetical protein [Methanomethylophilus alvi]|uniref:hypothetical protein n=1 Tax=Methanomethylophilus alvi TaxID=1291540 RepID=UPI0037DC7F6E